MKKINRGFSLAEVLIAVGIASVVATLGFSVAKRNLEQAYKGYVFNGYNSLQMALLDAKERKLSSFQEQESHVVNLMNATRNSDGVITAPNGIKYKFSKMGTYSLGDKTHDAYSVVMSAPQLRNSYTYEIVYLPNQDSFPILIPYGNDDGFIDHLQSRADLLAAYLVDNNGNNTYGSFQQIACRKYGNIILQNYKQNVQTAYLKFGFMNYYAAASGDEEYDIREICDNPSAQKGEWCESRAYPEHPCYGLDGAVLAECLEDRRPGSQIPDSNEGGVEDSNQEDKSDEGEEENNQEEPTEETLQLLNCDNIENLTPSPNLMMELIDPRAIPSR